MSVVWTGSCTLLIAMTLGILGSDARDRWTSEPSSDLADPAPLAFRVMYVLGS